MELFLLFKLTTRWKKCVHLSPPFNHNTLDFCLQLTNSKRAIISKSLIIVAFLVFSSSIKSLSSSKPSKTHKPSRRSFYSLYIVKHLLIPTLKSTFNALSLWEPKCNTENPESDKKSTTILLYPQYPLILTTCSRKWNTSQLHEGQLPQSRRIEKWSKPI